MWNQEPWLESILPRVYTDLRAVDLGTQAWKQYLLSMASAQSLCMTCVFFCRQIAAAIVISLYIKEPPYQHCLFVGQPQLNITLVWKGLSWCHLILSGSLAAKRAIAVRSGYLDRKPVESVIALRKQVCVLGPLNCMPNHHVRASNLYHRLWSQP